jgi:hypothetical protein
MRLRGDTQDQVDSLVRMRAAVTQIRGDGVNPDAVEQTNCEVAQDAEAALAVATMDETGVLGEGEALGTMQLISDLSVSTFERYVFVNRKQSHCDNRKQSLKF